MLDAMREVGPARCRGIVDIDEEASDAALERLHAIAHMGMFAAKAPGAPTGSPPRRLRRYRGARAGAHRGGARSGDL